MEYRRLNVNAAERFKKITLLHSNDMHGDFFVDKVDEKLTGGVSMLSGYLTKCRNEDPNVIYTIAGDMFRGSVIDSEFLGLSTIQIVNLLAPDVVTLGNHETDYGVAHLLFLEKMATFPIINANLYIKQNDTRLFNPCYIMEIDGMKILFIGILTEEVISQTKGENVIGSFIGIEEAASEVEKICNSYNALDIDLTVLLTHIGFEEDKKLASLIDPSWGIDIIIGGHSHTFITEPAIENGILIVQAGTGTDQIGRFDLIIDTLNNCIDSYRWTPVPINEDTCPRDERMEEFIGSIKAQTDLKYAKVVANFDYELEHQDRWMQTELGGVFADAMKDSLAVDLFFMGSGSVRKKHMGPIVTLQDLMEVFPYSDEMIGVNLTGAQLRQIMTYLMRDEAIVEGAHCECFQFSRGFFCEYDCSTHSIRHLAMNGKEVQDDDVFWTAIESYHYICMEESLGISAEEVEKNGQPVELAVGSINVLEAFLSAHDYIKLDEEERLVIHE